MLKTIIDNDTKLIEVNVYNDKYPNTNPSQQTAIEIELLENIFDITNFDDLDFVKVPNDSMIPYLEKNEMILIEKIKPTNGDIIYFTINEESYIGRWYEIPFTEFYKIENDNELYPVVNIDSMEKLNKTKIFGVVKKYGN